MAEPNVPYWLPEIYAEESDDWNGGGYPTSAWDHITIGSVEFFGVINVKIKGAYDIDAKKPKNISAARMEFGGYQPYDITITMHLYTKSHWETVVNDLIPLLRPKDSTDIPKAIKIAHPALRAVAVTEIVVKSISGPNSEISKSGRGDSQIKTFIIECLEKLPIEWRKEEKKDDSSKIIKGTIPLGTIDHLNKEFNSGQSLPPSEGRLGLNGGQTPQSLYAKTKKKAAAAQGD